jgi:hypothetical protein
MTNSSESLKNNHDRSLAQETGITEAQARELIDFLGMHRPSLLSEARLLKKARVRETVVKRAFCYSQVRGPAR